MVEDARLRSFQEAAILSRRDVTASAIRSCIAQSVDVMDPAGLSLFDSSDKAIESAADAWDCTEVLISSGHTRGDREERSSIRNGWEGKADRRILGLKLVSSFDNLARYGASIKRDFYRAMDLLMRLRTREEDPDSN